MGGKHLAQKDGGPRRPRNHSGKSFELIHDATKNALTNARAKTAALEKELLAKIENATKMENELANERGKTSALENELAAKIENFTKMENELAEERGKTSALQAEVHDLSSRVRHLADLSQRQQLDIQWLTGLKRDDVPTHSRLMRRQQR